MVVYPIVISRYDTARLAGLTLGLPLAAAAEVDPGAVAVQRTLDAARAAVATAEAANKKWVEPSKLNLVVWGFWQANKPPDSVLKAWSGGLEMAKRFLLQLDTTAQKAMADRAYRAKWLETAKALKSQVDFITQDAAGANHGIYNGLVYAIDETGKYLGENVLKPLAVGLPWALIAGVVIGLAVYIGKR